MNNNNNHCDLNECHSCHSTPDPMSSPFMCAVSGKMSYFEELPEKELQEILGLDNRDKNQNHVLHCAVLGNQKTLVQWILGKISDKGVLNCRDWAGFTPLHFAANEGHTKIVDILLSAGADPLLKSEDAVAYVGGTRAPIYITGSKTALHLAAERGNDKVIQLLLQYIQDPKIIQAKDADGNSAYDLALIKKNPSAARTLRPSADSPIEISTQQIQKITLEQHKSRSDRIVKLQLEKKQQEDRKILDSYKPLHPEIFHLDESILAKPFVEALRKGTTEALVSVMKKEADNLYSFEIFNLDFCKKLAAECENFENSGLPVRRPNSMNNYGVVLTSIGFDTMLSQVMQKYLMPISSVLFPDVGGASLDSHHSFSVRYKVGEDLDLGTHIDDAEVTLNVCLGDAFEGADLYFMGMRGRPGPKQKIGFTHTPGHALIHPGGLIHGVNPLKSGMRTNLIMWCRSSYFRSNAITFTQAGHPHVTFRLDPSTVTKSYLESLAGITSLLLLDSEGEPQKFGPDGNPVQPLDSNSFYTIADTSQFEESEEETKD